MAAGAGMINILEIVQTSIKEKRFCVTIPWVSEFLKLMAWDGTIRSVHSNYQAPRGSSKAVHSAAVAAAGTAVHQEVACVHYLVALLFADRQILERESMSSNR